MCLCRRFVNKHFSFYLSIGKLLYKKSEKILNSENKLKRKKGKTENLIKRQLRKITGKTTRSNIILI